MNIDMHLPVDENKFVEVNITDRQIKIEFWEDLEITATTSELLEDMGIEVTELSEFEEQH